MALVLLRGFVEVVYFQSAVPANERDIYPVSGMPSYGHSNQDPLSPTGRRHQRLLTAILSDTHDIWALFRKSLGSPQAFSRNQSVETGATQSKKIDISTSSALEYLTKIVNSTCQEMNFETGVEYPGSDLLGGVRNSHEIDATACCRRCEALEDCTHWTWSPDSLCNIRHGKLPRVENANLHVVSGRVSLNSFAHRVYNPDVLTEGDLRRISEVKDAAKKAAAVNPTLGCKMDPKDEQGLLNATNRPTSYIVINEPRSGSSWLQEISQMHPGIKVQFELDLAKGEAALRCMECHRPKIPVSKNVTRLPPKMHPPQACGMTVFGSANRFEEVSAMAERYNASLIILLRRNHVAHAISVYRHFNKPAADGLVPWGPSALAKSVDDSRQAYDRLLEYAARSGRRAHVVFYEDLKQQPREVWVGLQAFLGVPVVDVDGMEGLEKKSSNRPSVDYLRDLPALRRAHTGAPWAPMLLNRRYDEEQFDATATFEDACRRHPTARMSWRGGECPQQLASRENLSTVLMDTAKLR